MKQNLTDKREPRAQSSSLLAMTMYLDVSENQKSQAAGIVAKVGLVNNDSHVLELLNPFEMLQFLVVDAKGAPIHLPQKVPNLLRGKNSQSFDSLFPITAVSRNGKDVDSKDLKHETLRLAAGETLEVQFVIDRMVTVEKGQEAALPNGIYRISCIATVINAANREESRVLESPAIQVDIHKK